MDPLEEPLSVFSAIIPENVELPCETTSVVLEPDAILEPSAVLTPEKMYDCESCEKKIQLVDAIICKWCDSDYDSENDDDEDVVPSKNKESQHLFCKKCTRRCFVCNVRGCTDCIEVVCCDCGERMCSDCRNGDDLCGCYGNCYSCGTEVNRGSEGWPCNDCDKWYCDGCRQGDNPCPECGPGEDSEEEEDEEEDESTKEK